MREKLNKSSPDENLRWSAEKITGAFKNIFTELERIRHQAVEFDKEILFLREAAGDGSPGQENKVFIEKFIYSASNIAKYSNNAALVLGDRNLQCDLISASSGLKKTKDCVSELSSVSFLTKITQIEASSVSEQIAVFVQTLDVRLGDLRNSSTESSNLVSQIQRHSGFARSELSSLAREFFSMIQKISFQKGKLLNIEKTHKEYILKVDDEAEDLRLEVQKVVRKLVSCLQFPDAFSQRIEHVETAIRHVQKDDTAKNSAAVRKVISAQLRSIVKSLGAEYEKAENSFSRLNFVLDSYNSITKENDSHPSYCWIDAHRRTGETMVNSVTSAHKKFTKALQLLDELTFQIDRARENLRKSSELTHELETSVHNALLVANKSSEANSPLRFLAGCVKDVVSQSSHVVEKINDMLFNVRETSQTVERNNMKIELDNLAEIQNGTLRKYMISSKNIETMSKALDDLQCRSSSIMAASSAAKKAFEAAYLRTQELENVAKYFDTEAEILDKETCEIDWLYEIYTMEAERETHRVALGSEFIAETDDDLEEFLM